MRKLPWFSRLREENAALREEVLALESELIGARLDNVYLDKELAGRWVNQAGVYILQNTMAWGGGIKMKIW